MFDTDIMDITSESYEPIKYIVNSELRMSILQILYESESTFDDIKKEVQKQDSNISRALKELQELKLVEKNHKIFKLSSAGYLLSRNMITVMDNFYVLNKLRKCWNAHAVKNLPLYFSRFLFLWKNGEFINSNYIEYYKNIETFKEKIAMSKNIKIILPIYSRFHMEAVLKAIEDNNATLELVTSLEILNAIKSSPLGALFEKFRKEDIIRIWISDDNFHRIFYTVADNFASLTLFYVDESYDDSAMLFNDDMSNYDLFAYLFDDYKSNFRLLE